MKLLTSGSDEQNDSTQRGCTTAVRAAKTAKQMTLTYTTVASTLLVKILLTETSETTRLVARNPQAGELKQFTIVLFCVGHCLKLKPFCYSSKPNYAEPRRTSRVSLPEIAYVIWSEGFEHELIDANNLSVLPSNDEGTSTPSASTILIC